MRVGTLVSGILVSAFLFAGSAGAKESTLREVQIRDISTIEGVRENSLIGYGMVVGLNGTGDRQQTFFSTQTLANILQKMGVQINPLIIRVNNIAAVFVTATLPPFARPGTRIDVSVASIGDAKSLAGGTLLLTSLYGPDGQGYATAQGPLVLGAYTAGGRGNSVQMNHPTSGRIPAGAIVERAVPFDLSRMRKISLLLREEDFSEAQDVAAAINRNLGKDLARAEDGRRIEVRITDPSSEGIARTIAQLEGLKVTINPRAKVIVNERTGTIVMGQKVSLGACSIMHGGLAVEITTEYEVSQPPPLSQGQTAVVPQTTVRASETPAQRIELKEGATVDDLINGLQSIGATARDIVAILEAIKAAGALQAELEII
jgi:flagellar P-ring protein precursor FlgI